MKRPMLVFGTTAIVICSALTLFEGAFIAVPIISALVLFLYFRKKDLFKNNIIIPTICVGAIIFTLSFFVVNQTKITPVLEFDNTKQDIHGKIITLPQATDDTCNFVLLADKIGNKKVATKIEIAIPEDSQFKLYDYVVIKDASIFIPTKSNGAYDFSQVADGALLRAASETATFLWESNKTPYYYVLSLKATICQKTDDYLSTEAGGLFKGMLFGDKSHISTQTEKSFRASGISHLLAVSGLHTSLWCGLLLSLFSFLKLPRRLGNALCVIFLMLFCIAAAFTPSVIRASVMTATALISPFFKRTPDSLNSLGGAVCVLLVINPYIITSIGFQLSAAATLGVLATNNFSSKLSLLERKIPSPHLAGIISFILSSLLISCAAGIFTLPISAYHFGVISLMAPLSNILCIQLSFYALIVGSLAVAFSFINLAPFSPITVFLFKGTTLLLSIVATIAKSISRLKFCSVPISKATLVIYAIIIFTLICIAYFAHLKTSNKIIIKATAVVCAITTAFIICLPFIPFTQTNTITVFETNDGIHLLIKAGNHYAYLENSNSRLSTTEKRALPQSTSESLDYYIVSHIGKSSVDNLSYIASVYSPQNIMLSSSALQKAKQLEAEIPENATEVSNTTFLLNNEITTEIVDTGTIKYAIIKCGTESVYIHLYGNADHSDIIKQNDCKIAVFNGTPTKPLSVYLKTIIVSSSSATTSTDLFELEALCDTLYATAKHSDTTIYL